MSPRAVIRYLHPTLAVIMVLSLVGLSVRRNADWKTLLTIWSDCAAKSPAKSRVHNHLGNCYLLLRQSLPAIEEYRKAVALDPGNLEAVYNLAVSLDHAGSRLDAMAYYEKFCRSSSQKHEAQKAESCARWRELSEMMRD